MKSKTHSHTDNQNARIAVFTLFHFLLFIGTPHFRRVFSYPSLCKRKRVLYMYLSILLPMPVGDYSKVICTKCA